MGFGLLNNVRTVKILEILAEEQMHFVLEDAYEPWKARGGMLWLVPSRLSIQYQVDKKQSYDGLSLL